MNQKGSSYAARYPRDGAASTRVVKGGLRTGEQLYKDGRYLELFLVLEALAKKRTIQNIPYSAGPFRADSVSRFSDSQTTTKSGAHSLFYEGNRTCGFDRHRL